MIAHRFKAGSIMRLAISESLWPLVWPSPQLVRLELALGQASLTVPVRPMPATEPSMPIPITHEGFSRGEPVLEIAPPDAAGWVRARGAWPDQVSTVAGVGTQLSGGGPDMDLSWRPADPSSCVWTVRQSSRFRRGGWDCEMRVKIEMTANETTYFVKERLTALKNGAPWFEREQSDVVPRALT